VERTCRAAAEDLEVHLQRLLEVSAREEGLAAQQLRKDTAGRPDVDGLVVMTCSSSWKK
jgi:hypothetical protein